MRKNKNKKKEKEPLTIGFQKCDETNTHQCKHCGAKAHFLDEFEDKKWYACPQCRKLTSVKKASVV